MVTTRHELRGTCDRKQRRNYWEADQERRQGHWYSTGTLYRQPAGEHYFRGCDTRSSTLYYGSTDPDNNRCRVLHGGRCKPAQKAAENAQSTTGIRSRHWSNIQCNNQ